MAKIAAQVGNINKGRDYCSKGSNANSKYMELGWISGEVALWRRERDTMKRVPLPHHSEVGSYFITETIIKYFSGWAVFSQWVLLALATRVILQFSDTMLREKKKDCTYELMWKAFLVRKVKTTTLLSLLKVLIILQHLMDLHYNSEAGL